MRQVWVVARFDLQLLTAAYACVVRSGLVAAKPRSLWWDSQPVAQRATVPITA